MKKTIVAFIILFVLISLASLTIYLKKNEPKISAIGHIVKLNKKNTNYKYQQKDMPFTDATTKYYIKNNKTKIANDSAIIYYDKTKNKVYYQNADKNNFYNNNVMSDTIPENVANSKYYGYISDINLLIIFDTILPTAKVTGEEMIENKNCLVVEAEVGDGKGKYWFWEKYGIPIKIELYDNKGNLKISTGFDNIEFGNVTDKEVSIPKDVNILE